MEPKKLADSITWRRLEHCLLAVFAKRNGAEFSIHRPLTADWLYDLFRAVRSADQVLPNNCEDKMTNEWIDASKEMPSEGGPILMLIGGEIVPGRTYDQTTHFIDPHFTGGAPIGCVLENETIIHPDGLRQDIVANWLLPATYKHPTHWMPIQLPEEPKDE